MAYVHRYHDLITFCLPLDWILWTNHFHPFTVNVSPMQNTYFSNRLHFQHPLISAQLQKMWFNYQLTTPETEIEMMLAVVPTLNRWGRLMTVECQAACSETQACKAESGAMLVHVVGIITVEVEPRAYWTVTIWTEAFLLFVSAFQNIMSTSGSCETKQMFEFGYRHIATYIIELLAASVEVNHRLIFVRYWVLNSGVGTDPWYRPQLSLSKSLSSHYFVISFNVLYNLCRWNTIIK